MSPLIIGNNYFFVFNLHKLILTSYSIANSLGPTIYNLSKIHCTHYIYSPRTLNLTSHLCQRGNIVIYLIHYLYLTTENTVLCKYLRSFAYSV